MSVVSVSRGLSDDLHEAVEDQLRRPQVVELATNLSQGGADVASDRGLCPNED
jgi:hypothetical protein